MENTKSGGNGYILNMYKKSFGGETADFSSQLPHHAVFGHYDKIELLEAAYMHEYFFSNETKLPGEKQSFHLYKMGGEVFLPKKNDRYVTAKCNAPQKGFPKIPCKLTGTLFVPRYLFITLLELNHLPALYFSGAEGRKRFLRNIAQKIQELLEALPPKKRCVSVDYEVLSCFGASEVAILWYTDFISLPGQVIISLRDLFFTYENAEEPVKENIFFSGVTLVSVLKNEDDAQTQYIRGDESQSVLMNITFKSGADRPEFWKKLFKEFNTFKEKSDTDITNAINIHVQERFGNQDSVLQISCTEIPHSLFFGHSDPRNGDFFHKDCLQSHTRLLYPHSAKASSPELILAAEDEKHYYKWALMISWPDEEERAARVAGLARKTNKIIEKFGGAGRYLMRNSHIQETLTQLMRGFSSCYASLQNRVWAEDLAIQYDVFLDAAAGLLEELEGNPENYGADSAKRLVHLINAMHQTYRHINQGSRIFFDAPGGSLSYSGSYRRIIWAYNGICKQILSVMYDLDSTQRQLIPILVFTSASEISSEEYRISKEKALAVISLPNDALYSLSAFTAYLAHEFCHYRKQPEGFLRTLAKNILAKFVMGAVLPDPCTWGSKEDTEKNRTTMEKVQIYINNRDFSLLNNLDDENYSDFSQSTKDFLWKTLAPYWGEKETPAQQHLEKETPQGFLPSLFPPGMTSREGWNPSVDSVFYDEAYKTQKGLIEAVCDQFMLDIIGMDANGYFDFMADCFYAKMKETTDEPGQSLLASSYTIQLGLVFSYFAEPHFSPGDSIDPEALRKKVKALIAGWKRRCKKKLRARRNEGRSTARIEHRIQCAELYKNMHREFVSLYAMQRTLMDAFALCTVTEAPRADVLRRDEAAFLTIQSAPETKSVRAARVFRLDTERIENFARQTETWDSIRGMKESEAAPTARTKVYLKTVKKALPQMVQWAHLNIPPDEKKLPGE